MKFNNLISQLAYTLLLPRTGIKPLDLIIRQEKNFFSFFKADEGSIDGSSLKDLFPSGQGAKYPTIKKATLPSVLSGSDILETKSSFVTNFLQNNSAKVSLENSKTVIFSFENAISSVVSELELNSYLQSNLPNSANEDLIKKGNLYLILGVLASKKFSIQPSSNFEISGELSTAELAKYIAELKASASHKSQATHTIKQEGDEYMTFAIQTAQVSYKKNKYSIVRDDIIVRNSFGDNSKAHLTLFNEDNEIILS